MVGPHGSLGPVETDGLGNDGCGDVDVGAGAAGSEEANCTTVAMTTSIVFHVTLDFIAHTTNAIPYRLEFRLEAVIAL